MELYRSIITSMIIHPCLSLYPSKEVRRICSHISDIFLSSYLCLNLADVGVAPCVVGSCLDVAIGVQVAGQEGLCIPTDGERKWKGG